MIVNSEFKFDDDEVKALLAEEPTELGKWLEKQILTDIRAHIRTKLGKDEDAEARLALSGAGLQFKGDGCVTCTLS